MASRLSLGRACAAGGKRRGCAPRTVWLVCTALLGLAALGAVYQFVGERADLRAHPAPGALIDVGGYRLHLYCVGQGTPTMILLHGLGGNVYHWAQIQPALAGQFRVCAYDRAGYGWSDPGPQPRSLAQNARELRALRENAGIAGPLVLVGHSYGTNLAQVYAGQYPDGVAGLVLIDGGIAAEAVRRCPSFNCMPPTARIGTDVFLTVQPGLFRVGLLRLFGFPQAYGDNLKSLTPEQRAAFTAGYGQTRGADSNLAEWWDWDTAVGRGGEPGSLGALPVRALMADERLPDWSYGGEPEKWRAYEQDLLVELTRLSTDSRVTVIPDSDHASMLFEQSQWQHVVDAVVEIAGLIQ